MGKRNVLTAVTLAVAASASMADTATPQALALPSSLTLDGYCDGFTNIVATGRPPTMP